MMLVRSMQGFFLGVDGFFSLTITCEKFCMSWGYQLEHRKLIDEIDGMERRRKGEKNCMENPVNWADELNSALSAFCVSR